MHTQSAFHSLQSMLSYRTQNTSVNFTHVAYDSIGDRLYVGASNHLLQLGATHLSLQAVARTGPLMDSLLCSPGDCTPDAYNLVSTVNTNKLLLLDSANNRLLACGSAQQGACRFHSMSNVSDSQSLIQIPVAANDEQSSTLALLVNSPLAAASSDSGSSASGNILYVATTNSRLGPYRDMIPAICARSFENGPKQLNVIEADISDSARLDIDYHLRDYFLVTYVHAFEVGPFVYFASTQPRSHSRALEELGFGSRLARVCTADPGFRTYSEMGIQCLGADRRAYPLLQAATVISAGSAFGSKWSFASDERLFVGLFARSKEHTNRPAAGGALCVYPYSDINALFNDNVQRCFNGTVSSRNMHYIANSIENCPNNNGVNNEKVDVCGETIRLNGSIPLIGTAAIEYPDEVLTSIAAHTAGQHNVAFVGTSSGHLKKILLNNVNSASEFEDIAIDAGHRILPDMHLDRTQQHVFVASPYQITKVPIERCDHLRTCRDCLHSRSPYCGWSSLENRCISRTVHQNRLLNNPSLSSQSASASSSNWLTLDPQKCVDVQSISPETFPIDSNETINLVISQLPRISSPTGFLCVFNNEHVSRARVSGSALRCDPPPMDRRPRITPPQDHVTVDLAIRTPESSTNFLQKDYILFDCSVHNTCSDCMQSRWQCSWCVSSNRCLSNSSACSAFSSSKVEFPKENSVKSIEQCPRVIGKQEVLLPAQIETEITMDVQNLPNNQNQFGCLIEFDGQQHSLPLTIVGNKVTCAKKTFNYESEEGQIRGQVSIVRGENRLIRVPLLVYKCSRLATHSGQSDCSLCRAYSHLQCNWCGSGCVHQSECNQGSDSQIKCPAPRIDWIHPLSGPVEGGTLVAIQGSNLGSSLAEIAHTITIGGIPCEPIAYNTSTRVICRTGPAPSALTGDILIGNQAGYTRAREKFRYERVSLRSVSPSHGPRSGGTRLYLSGNSLNIGSNVRVWLDGVECELDRTLASSGQISCVTGRLSSNGGLPRTVRSLRLQIDNCSLHLQNAFTYTEDPVIRRVHPLHSYASGGRWLHVFGNGLASVQQPRIAILDSNEQHVLNHSTCELLSDEQMRCLSPSLPSHLMHTLPQATSNQNWLRLRLAFLMDDVLSVRHLAQHMPGAASLLSYVPDPIARLQPALPNNDPMQAIVIRGERLRAACSEAELLVSVSGRRCNVTSFTDTQIVCQPPFLTANTSIATSDMQSNTVPTMENNGVQLSSHSFWANGHTQQPMVPQQFVSVWSASGVQVQLQFGRQVTLQLGELQVGDDRSLGVADSWNVLGVLAAVGILLTVVGFLLQKSRSTRSEREYKRMQLQLDSLESHVRAECKQNVVALQNELSELRVELDAGGLPTRPHRQYVLKVLFPGVREHPLSRPPLQMDHVIGQTATGQQMAMRQFEQLLHNRCFLLRFIQTLEAQRSFTIRDRVNVASLLTVLLMERMEYFTDVLRALLHQLAAKAAQSRQPQLMLRRTESVVEKMLSNWLALCMYDHLRADCGRSLYLLFAAVKAGVDCGPVDAQTGQARFALDDRLLLRTRVHFEQVMIRLQQEPPAPFVVCTVLDCDSISQVKRKLLDALYRSTPFSLRPSADDLQLEWLVDGPNGVKQRPLSDNDPTSIRLAGHQRINTLAHYGIRGSADMRLVMRRNSVYDPPMYDSHLSNNLYEQPLYERPHGSSLSGEPIYERSAYERSLLEPMMNSSMSNNLNRFHLTPPMSSVFELSVGTLPQHASAAAAASLGCNSLVNTGFGRTLGAGFRSTHVPLSPNASFESGSSCSPADQIGLLSSCTGSSADSGNGSTMGTLRLNEDPQPPLARQLATKASVLRYVEEFLGSILHCDQSPVPAPIKWLFDLLDEAAATNGIHDQQVISAWKSNALPLRFWLNLVRNPDFALDVQKSRPVDGSLCVIAQALMDACDPYATVGVPSSSAGNVSSLSPSPITNLPLLNALNVSPFGMSSPTSATLSSNQVKHASGTNTNSTSSLLFARQAATYRQKVQAFYSHVRSLPPIQDQELSATMQCLSLAHSGEFDQLIALKELYVYATKYWPSLCESLASDSYCNRLGLLSKLQQAANILSGHQPF